MLQNIRDNSQGWIAKTIIGVVVVLLALTGFDAIFNAARNRDTVAEVNGEDISQSELTQAVNMQRRQLAQQLGDNFDPSLLNEGMLRQSALAGLIERMLLLQGAKKAGFDFSDAALDQLILQTPEFQVEGRFQPARFDQALQQMGYTRMQFRQLLAQEMLIAQLRAGIAGTAFVTDQQVRQFAQLERQTRDFSSHTLAAHANAVQVSNDEIDAYYEANAQQFRSPEQVVLDYVELNKADFFDQVEVSDDELQSLYKRQIANLAEQRRAAHILVEVNDETDDKAAKARIEALAERLNNGESFEALAKEASEDTGSASEGGDLGFAGPGVYDESFEKALYALDKGQVSAPVRSAFGWHLIKLLDVRAPEVPSFESLRPELERELKAQQVEQRFVEASKQLEDSAFEAADLAQPAQELGLKVKTTAPFGREGGEGIAANRQVVQAAFSDEVLTDGANSAVIELDPETAVVVRVKQHLEPETLPLDQVHDRIAQQLRNEKAAELARSEGEKLLTQLRAGETKAAGDAWKHQEAVTRNQEGLDPAVLQALFRMPKPEGDDATYAGVALGNGDYVVLALHGVAAPADALNDQETQEYRRFLASRAGQQDFSAYREWLQSLADIERE